MKPKKTLKPKLFTKPSLFVQLRPQKKRKESQRQSTSVNPLNVFLLGQNLVHTLRYLLEIWISSILILHTKNLVAKKEFKNVLECIVSTDYRYIFKDISFILIPPT